MEGSVLSIAEAEVIRQESEQLTEHLDAVALDLNLIIARVVQTVNIKEVQAEPHIFQVAGVRVLSDAEYPVLDLTHRVQRSDVILYGRADVGYLERLLLDK